jgi:hypothetical protein
MPSFNIDLASAKGCKFSVKNNLTEGTVGFNFFSNVGLDIFVSKSEWGAEGLELPEMMIMENDSTNISGRIAVAETETYQVVIVNNKEVDAQIVLQYGGSVGLTAAVFALFGSFSFLF